MKYIAGFCDRPASQKNKIDILNSDQVPREEAADVLLENYTHGLDT